MASKPALKLEPAYRSGLEKNIAAQLEAEGLPFEFEKLKLTYLVPERTSKYTPEEQYEKRLAASRRWKDRQR